MADHPSVTDAAVMPFKHEIHQAVPVCAVELHPGAQTTEAELLEYGRKRLGTRSAKFVFVVEEVPRNHLGKLIRSEMAEIMRARMKTRFQ
jgi:cyanophycin synthetase